MTNYIQDLVCPLCNRQVVRSSYLMEVFKDQPKACYLAHLVTHYRHNHITSWNRCWEHDGNRYRRDWFTDYEVEKQIVNERAKRQIIRKAKDILKRLEITPEDFAQLEGTEPHTMKVANKLLVTQKPSIRR